ncbi:MAG: hypothetical protein KDB27_30790, partial [Planctomycetales bacterium]|nr:hypothetical protein [Planctomycetales bacterium]
GRTYIRCDDRDLGNIDVRAAVDRFIAGRVSVSYGLLAELTVDDKYRPGDLARVGSRAVGVSVRVLGPDWVEADRIRLYSNGQLIRDEPITSLTDRESGVLWTGKWTIELPSHDVHLVAIASGPGVNGLYWKTAKPYQPTSPIWEPQVFSCTGAIWLDVDGDGRKTSAYDYAQQLFLANAGNVEQLLASLDKFDQAVATQAASLFQSSGRSWLDADVQKLLRKASPATQAGVQSYLNAWRANQLATPD